MKRLSFVIDTNILIEIEKNNKAILSKLAEIKRYVSKLGIMIPTFDLFIASIVIDSGMPLVTLDKHFKRVSNLNVILLEKF